MQKQISEFPLSESIIGIDYFVFQSSTRQTKRTDLARFIFNTFLSKHFNLHSDLGILITNDNLSYYIKNSSLNTSLNIISKNGIRVQKNDLVFTISNIDMASSLVFRAGPGILIDRENALTWVIKNCAPGSKTMIPELRAGRSITVEQLSPHKWKVSYSPFHHEITNLCN